MEEASERYQIPLEVLREYESWGLCGAVKRVRGAWQYDEQDLERLSAIMGLYETGFTDKEAEAYMRLLLEASGSEEECLLMLTRKRAAVLEEIHFKERQLDRLDCLRHKIEKNGRGGSRQGV